MRLMASALLLLGCSAHYVGLNADVHAAADAHRPEQALRMLEERHLRESLDGLLFELDRGMLLHQAKRFAESAEAFNRAAALAHERETVRLIQELFARVPWRAGTLELQALHAVNALNYLLLKNWEEAAVEARLTDAEQLRLRMSQEARERFERQVALVSVDERIRGYLERLAIGAYISGLARESAGDEEGAFIDYYAAYQMTRGAPPGAPTSVDHLLPSLSARAEKLGRQTEASALREVYPDLESESVGPSTGELVVIAGIGRAPERAVHTYVAARGETRGERTMRARPWEPRPNRLRVADREVELETVTSLENIWLRRGHLGVVTDTQRPASITANAISAGAFIVFPLGMYLVLHRALELDTQMSQAWLTLPAEFKVARVRLPAGEHTAALGSETKKVTVAVGHPSIWVLTLRQTKSAP